MEFAEATCDGSTGVQTGVTQYDHQYAAALMTLAERALVAGAMTFSWNGDARGMNVLGLQPERRA